MLMGIVKEVSVAESVTGTGRPTVFFSSEGWANQDLILWLVQQTESILRNKGKAIDLRQRISNRMASCGNMSSIERFHKAFEVLNQHVHLIDVKI